MEAGADAHGLGARADLVTPMALRVAATLRLADGIRDGLVTAAALAAARGADADALDRLLRHLATIGVVTRDVSDEHALTELGAQLCDDHAGGLRKRLDCTGALGRAELAFVGLLHAVTTGQAAFPAVHGDDFWADLAADAERTADYDARMGEDVAAWALDLLAAYPWGALGHLVDVGGGDGTLLAALLDANAGLRGTVLDQSATAAAARRTLAAAGLADRAGVVAGSFFEPLPAGADAYLLCAVLHNWDDEPASAILRGCAAAAGPTGRVLVVEKTGPDGASPSSAMDLRTLVYFGARERTAPELVALAADAGLCHVATHVAGALSIVELRASG